MNRQAVSPAPAALGLGPVAAAYLCALLLGSVGLSIALAAGASEKGFASLLAGMAGLWAGMGLAIIPAVRRTPDRFGGLSPSRANWLAAAAGVVCQLAVLPLLYAPLRLLFDLDVDGKAEDTLDRAHGWQLGLLVVVLVVGAPLIEEAFWRGTAQQAAVAQFGLRVGVGLTAIVFAGVHFQLIQFPGLLIAALLFGVLTARRGRIGASVWAHAGFNAATVAVLLAS